MKSYEQIKEALENAISGHETVGEDEVSQACEAVQQAGTDLFGAGVYVSGILNYDAGGVSFRWKRPSIRERYEFFVPAQLVKRQGDDVQDADTNTDSQDAGSVSRQVLFEDALPKLTEDDYTDAGKPKVEALNRYYADRDDVEDFSAKERDELWDLVKPAE